MLIGAHVSPAGGPAKAVERGVERACRSIQIFNQSPRAWRPREYADEEVADFRAAMAATDVDALLIHAVYLLNCASEDPGIRGSRWPRWSRALTAGAALGAACGGPAPRLGAQGRGRRRRGDRARRGRDRRGPRRDRGLRAAPGGHRGRRRHARALVRGAGAADRAGGRRRAARRVPGLLPPAGLGLRHPRPRRGSPRCSTSFDARRRPRPPRLPARQRLDDPAGLQPRPPREPRRRARSARGLAAFLSEPRFEGLPCVFEGPGATGKAVERVDIENALALREAGLAARAA